MQDFQYFLKFWNKFEPVYKSELAPYAVKALLHSDEWFQQFSPSIQKLITKLWSEKKIEMVLDLILQFVSSSPKPINTSRSSIWLNTLEDIIKLASQAEEGESPLTPSNFYFLFSFLNSDVTFDNLFFFFLDRGYECSVTNLETTWKFWTIDETFGNYYIEL